MKIKITLLLVLFALICMGCSYIEQRGRDLSDCFKISFDYGIGASTRIQFLPLSVGVGYWEGRTIGLYGNSGLINGREVYFGFPVFPLLIGLPWLIGPESGHGRYSGFQTEANTIIYEFDKITYSKRQFSLAHMIIPYLPIIGEEEQKYRLRSITDYFWVSFEVKLFLGIKIGINILEVADFVLGLFGIDILDDDSTYAR